MTTKRWNVGTARIQRDRARTLAADIAASTRRANKAREQLEAQRSELKPEIVEERLRAIGEELKEAIAGPMGEVREIELAAGQQREHYGRRAALVRLAGQAPPQWWTRVTAASDEQLLGLALDAVAEDRPADLAAVLEVTNGRSGMSPEVRREIGALVDALPTPPQEREALSLLGEIDGVAAEALLQLGEAGAVRLDDGERLAAARRVQAQRRQQTGAAP